MYWAIAAGIEGNLAAYEAVLKDLRQSRLEIETLYLLGDVIGPRSDCARVIDRIQQPRSGELRPVICQGWWEEQCLILHGLGRTGEPTQMFDRYGKAMVKTLWDAVPRDYVEWIRGFEFGFAELDCLLIHGSSIGVDEELTPETPAITLIDRLNRMNVNHLFCARSGQAFEYKIQHGAIATAVSRLDQTPVTASASLANKRVIGVGNVGRTAGTATYTLYHPGSNQLQFKTVKYSAARGFRVACR
jgi:hypothetical protein